MHLEKKTQLCDVIHTKVDSRSYPMCPWMFYGNDLLTSKKRQSAEALKGVDILSDDPVPGRKSKRCSDNLSTHRLSEFSNM